MMEHKVIKICKCGNRDEVELTKREAAFDLHDTKEFWDTKCSKCGKKKWFSSQVTKPGVDKELLLEWGNNTDLFFDEQSEEYILAEEKYIDLILDILDNYSIFEANRNMLVIALCLIICGNSAESKAKNWTSEEVENRSKIVASVAKELKARKKLVLLAEDWIMDSIKEEVFPILGLKYSKALNHKLSFWSKLKHKLNNF
jgi:predicted nucleic-acid-binding Zn-ribbon protein